MKDRWPSDKTLFDQWLKHLESCAGIALGSFRQHNYWTKNDLVNEWLINVKSYDPSKPLPFKGRIVAQMKTFMMYRRNVYDPKGENLFYDRGYHQAYTVDYSDLFTTGCSEIFTIVVLGLMTGKSKEEIAREIGLAYSRLNQIIPAIKSVVESRLCA